MRHAHCQKEIRSHSRKRTCFLFALLIVQILPGQVRTDSAHQKKWTVRFQCTVISQIHSGFRSYYSGANSLADSVEPAATSVTSTLFLGRKLWRGAAAYVDPEMAGGKGLSFTKGVAGALNGETYRVGSTTPQPFIARAYVQQNIPLGHSAYTDVEEEANQLPDKIPENRITITAGKFAISDFFDDNTYSKDPRTQYLNWSIWANGAWDYPANTRGYTCGIVLEFIKRAWAVRLSSVAVPSVANFHLMEYHIPGAHSETVEYDRQFFIHKRKGNVRLIVSGTYSRAPSYAQGLAAIAMNDSSILNVIAGNAKGNSYGGQKFGVGLNVEQELTEAIGIFSRVGWNDGRFVSWAFTEIDRTFTAGLSLRGSRWGRDNDVFGVAMATNGISGGHRTFLQDGGYGFIIGDGRLTYGHETIAEAFYSARVMKFFWLSLDYQFVKNPGYNQDRGPVHVFGIRGHVEF